MSGMRRITTFSSHRKPPEVTPAQILRIEEWERNEQREKWRGRLQASGIPKRYRQASLKACPPEVRAYAEGFGKETERGLILRGGFGTGKTTAACAVAIEVAKRHPVRFVTMPDLIARATDFERGGMDCFRNTRLLVLDDLGKERGTEFAVSEVYSVIDFRVREGKPTVITTNLDSAGLMRHFKSGTSDDVAGSIVSRILGMCDVVEMNGADWRLQKPR